MGVTFWKKCIFAKISLFQGHFRRFLFRGPKHLSWVTLCHARKKNLSMHKKVTIFFLLSSDSHYEETIEFEAHIWVPSEPYWQELSEMVRQYAKLQKMRSLGTDLWTTYFTCIKVHLKILQNLDLMDHPNGIFGIRGYVWGYLTIFMKNIR